MSKRFTDTEKFNDPWYMKLDLLHKVIWEYLLAECNHAGILEKFNIELMNFKIGATCTLEDFKVFGDRVIFITDEILYIPKFIIFQYGELNPQNKVHASVLRELEKYNLQGANKPLTSPLLGAKDKDKDKDNNSSSLVLSSSCEKPKDLTANPDFEKYFKSYAAKCPNLLPLSFERRSKNILEELRTFLTEIDYDHEYFANLCNEADALRKIAENRIDFRSMIRNHIGIMNGKYSRGKPSGNEFDKVLAQINAKKEAERLKHG